MTISAQVLRQLAKSTHSANLYGLSDYAALQETVTKAQGSLAKIKQVPNLKEILASQYADQWAERARKYRGQPFSFAGMELWRADGSAGGGLGPLRSTARSRLVHKPRKIAHTEIILCEMGFRVCKHKNPPANVGWFVHSDGVAQDVSAQRFDPAVDQTPVLSASLKDDNVGRKSFVIDGVERFWFVSSARSSRKGEEGNKAVGLILTDVMLDEIQKHPEGAMGYITGAAGWERFRVWAGGTPRTLANQINKMLLAGTHYVAYYLCPHCGHIHHPELDVDSSNMVPVSASIGENPEWDGVTTPELIDNGSLPCVDCRYPIAPCERRFKCRHLIMVCPKCGGSLEHLRGRAGICDDGIGTDIGAVVWESQNPGAASGDSWEWTPFDVAYYSMDRKIQSIQALLDIGDIRGATNEEIGKPYTGSVGCIVSHGWIDSGKLPTVDKRDALSGEYLLRIFSGDWGSEEGMGTWGGMIGITRTLQPVLLDAEQFQGEFIPQAEDAAKWGSERGMDIALLDQGHSEGRERQFYPYIARSNVFLVSHRKMKGQAAVEEWLTSDIEEIAKTRVFVVKKAILVANMVAILRRGRDGGLLIPWKRPEEFSRFIEQFYNLYRRPKQPSFTADGLEIERDDDDDYVRGGPDHFLQVIKFALAIFHSEAHLRFFLSCKRYEQGGVQ